MGLTVDWGREIADQISDRRLKLAIRGAPAAACIVHPRAAALAFARVKIQIKLSDQLAVLVFHPEKAHVGMPDGRIIGANGDREKRLSNVEHPGEHHIDRKVLPDFVLRKCVTALAQFFSRKSDIPRREFRRIEFLRGESAQLLPFPLCVGRARCAKSWRKANTCCGDSAIFDASETSAKLRYPSICASCARSMSCSAIFAVLSHSALPCAYSAPSFGSVTCGCAGVVRQSGQLILLGYADRIRIGGIKRMIGEFFG